MSKGVSPRRQSPVPGGRRQLSSAVLGKIRERVEQEAARHNVGKSFVVAVTLAHAFGIKEQERY